jgi:hypothetical protein
MIFRAPTITDKKTAGKALARLHLDARRRRDRALRTNRLTFAGCTAAAIVAAAEHLVFTAFLMLGCVVVLGILMAKVNETEWVGAIEQWERVP